MEKPVRSDPLLPPAAGNTADQAAYGVEHTAEFQAVDAMVSAYDAEGLGPLRKGERAFQWDTVLSACEALLNQAADLRVAVWLLRAYLEVRGACGLPDGLARINAMLALPDEALYPRAMEGESARDIHAVSLAWVGSAALLHRFRVAPLAPNTPINCTDLHKDHSVAETLDAAAKAALAAKLQRGIGHLDCIADMLIESPCGLTFNTASLRDEMAFACKALGAEDASQNPLAAHRSAALQPQATPHAPPHWPVLCKREEVQQTLSGLIDYFKEFEPGHPAPLLLARVQRMLGASFEDLMGELYADATQLVARIKKPHAL